MKKNVFIALLLLPAMQVVGQPRNIDSLLNLLETKKLTSLELINLYTDISSHYLENDNEKTIKYAGEGLKLAEKEKDKEKISSFCNLLGISYYTLSKYDTAYLYLQKSLELAVELKDKVNEAGIYMFLGNLFRRQTNYEEAINYYSMSMRISDSTNNKERYATTLVNIGGVYRLTGDRDKALEYLEQAETISEEVGATYLQLNVSYQLGSLYNAKSQLDKALEYALKTDELSRLIGEKKMEISNLYLLSTVYVGLKDYDKARDYINQCLPLAEEYGDKRLLMGIILGAASIYFNENLFEECAELSLKAWNIDSTDFNYAKDASFFLIQAYIMLGNKEQAINFLTNYNEIIRARDSKQYQDALADMEVKYETEKKETRIATLESERKLYIWLSIVGGFLLVSLVVSLLLTIRNARKKRQLIARESLQEGEIGERARIAKDLHDRLGSSLVAVKIGLKDAENLPVVRDKLDTCIIELREIINNIMPVSLQKFGLKVALEDFSGELPNLHFHFFGEEIRFNSNQEYAVYCCARELVNNAMKHSGATDINMQLIQNRKHLSLTVQDNGCGFYEKSVEKGYGLGNIRNRVTTCQGKLDIISAPGKGTETVITISHPPKG